MQKRMTHTVILTAAQFHLIQHKAAARKAVRVSIESTTATELLKVYYHQADDTEWHILHDFTQGD